MSWPFVATMIERDVVSSTSDVARELAAGGAPLPLAVWAARQTHGRGRGTNRWWSGAGSLTFTVALDPAAHGLRPEHEPRLALATAVAIVDAIAVPHLAAPLGIRWPNDIEAGGRKLGGILPERVDTARGLRLLIGVGLNVTTPMDDAPPEVRRMATSLAELRTPPEPVGAVETVFCAILAGLPGVLDQLARDDPALAARWAALDALRGQAIQIDLGPRKIAGIARAIDAEGALCLDAEEGPLRLFGGQVLRP
jgi:BirA family biotin operon repressor/biotin-[acetyl-CoA-carboxylase] ligase